MYATTVDQAINMTHAMISELNEAGRTTTRVMPDQTGAVRDALAELIRRIETGQARPWWQFRRAT